MASTKSDGRSEGDREREREKEMKDLKAQQIFAAKQISELKKQTEAQSTEINQLKSQLSQSQSDAQKFKNAHTTDVKAEKAKCEGVQKSLNQADVQLKQYKRQLEELTKTLAESIDVKKKLQALQSDYQSTVDSHAKEKTALSNELRKLREELGSLRGDKKQQHSAQAQEETEYDALQRRLLAQETESRNAHLALVKENNTLMEAKRKVEVQLVQAQKKASDLEVTNRALNNRVGDLERELNVVFRTQAGPRSQLKSPRPLLPEPSANMRWTKEESLSMSGRNLKNSPTLENNRRKSVSLSSGDGVSTPPLEVRLAIAGGGAESPDEVSRLQKKAKTDAATIQELRTRLESIEAQLAVRDAELQQERQKTSSLFARINVLELEREPPMELARFARSPPPLQRVQSLRLTPDAQDEAVTKLSEDAVRVFSSPVQTVVRLLVALVKDPRTKAFRKELEDIIRGLLSANQYNPDFERLFHMAGVDQALQDWVMYEFSRDGPSAAWLPVSASPMHAIDAVPPEPFPPVLDMSIIDDWGYASWDLKGEQFCTVYVGMLESLGLLERFPIHRNNLTRFLRAVMKVYQENPYHTFQHAVDVAQMCYKMINMTKASDLLSELEILTLMVAALCHDVDHPGLNNMFQINERSPLALLYNDKTVLESHHASLSWRILSEAENNIFVNFEPIDAKTVRRGMISCILATDMSKHFKLVTKLTTALQDNKFEQKTPDSRQLLMNLILHMADISNVTRPWEVSKQWSDLVLEEFLAQGDLEKQRKLPVSPFMDRDSTDQAKMSLGFIDFMVSPLLVSLKRVIPEIEPMWVNLKANREIWDEMMKRKTEANTAELQAAASAKPPPSPRRPPTNATLTHQLTLQSSSMMTIASAASGGSVEPLASLQSSDSSSLPVGPPPRSPMKSMSEATEVSGPSSDLPGAGDDEGLSSSDVTKPMQRWDSEAAGIGDEDDTATIIASPPPPQALPVHGSSPRRKTSPRAAETPAASSPRGVPVPSAGDYATRRLSKSASDLELLSSLERRSVVHLARPDDEAMATLDPGVPSAIRSLRDSAANVRITTPPPLSSSSPRGLVSEAAATGRRPSKDFDDAMYLSPVSPSDSSEVVLLEETPLATISASAAFKSPRGNEASAFTTPFTRITKSPIRMPSAPDFNKRNRSSLPVISGAVQNGGA